MTGQNPSVIVIPTYNEKDNIRPLLEDIDRAAGSGFDVLFVDDNSPDGTAGLIEDVACRRPGTYLMRRPAKLGLGSAYLAGFGWALDKGYEYIFEMDADLSHSPRYLEPMTAALRDFDVAVTSRFRGKLRNINKTPLRVINSILAAMFMKMLLGIDCSDPMGGFNGFRRKAIVRLDLSGFVSKGYAFQAEIKYKCKKNGCSFSEVPIVFRDRDSGASKISRKDILEAMCLPLKLSTKKT